MRLGIVADVHSNLPALTAVLADIRSRKADRVSCLGDLVGYNTFPRETLSLLRQSGIPSIQGNHDLMAIGLLEPTDCGPSARAAIGWTRGILSEEERAYLGGLPPHALLEPDAIHVHSCLGDCVVRLDRPERFLAQRETLKQFDASLRLCFTGHTHVQQVTEIDAAGQVTVRRAGRLRLKPSSFYFINPGSVGHPREADYRACYAIYDSAQDEVTFRKVRYDRRAMRAENSRNGIATDLGLPVGAHHFRGILRVLGKVARRVEQVHGR
jgi:predicted phosphodiesterase